MSAKDLHVAPIASPDAHAFMHRHHYSGKSVNNSQLHLGAFMGKRLVGVAQFGPPMDRRKLLGLVRGTAWNDMLELNRLAMVDDTPRNSESRFLAVCFRLIRKRYPHIEWVVSFADAAQCGDGTIYRAAGFALTGIKRNTQIWEMPGGEHVSRVTATDTCSPARQRLFSRTALTDGRSKQQQARTLVSRTTMTKGGHIKETGGASMRLFVEAGAKPLPGFQLRYVYFLNPAARDRLTVPVLPFSAIDEHGARMYRGKSPEASSDAPAIHAGEGGAAPTPALQDKGTGTGGRMRR